VWRATLGACQPVRMFDLAEGLIRRNDSDAEGEAAE
jgi:hypothetical protein